MAKQFHYLISAAAGMTLAVMSGCGDNNVQCGEGTMNVGNECVPQATCGDGTEIGPDGTCRAVCAPGTMFNPDSGQCAPDITGCAPNMVVVDGVCHDGADVPTDYMEPAEPNGFEPGSNPLAVDLPEIGGSVTIGGCTEPQPGPGPDVADFDAYIITANGPMVLDVTVDGYNGMAGAFAVIPLEAALADNEWQRLGLNLVDDMAQREVFLPMAGTYILAITDSRTFFTGPSGDGTTCYLATVSAVGLPTPAPIVDMEMGVLNGQVQAYVFDPVADDIIFNTGSTATAGALIDTVVLINDQYHQSAPGLDSRAPGEDAATAAAGLADEDLVVIYVEAVVDFDLAQDDFLLEIHAGRPVPLPTDGSTITIDNDGAFFRWLTFDATAGDVVHINMFSDAPDGTLVSVVDSDLQPVSALCSGPCPDYNGFLRFDQTGRYYIALLDTSDPQPTSFQLTSTVYVHTPTAFAPGTTQVGLELDADGSRFFTLDVNQLSWWRYDGGPTLNFMGELDINVFPNYPENQRGALGDEIPRVTRVNGLDAASDVGGIFDAGTMLLLHATDDGFVAGGTPGTYDLGLVDRVYTDVGLLDPAAPYMNSGLTFSANEVYRFLMRVDPFHAADIAATGDVATDLELVIYDAFEGTTVIDNNFNAGGTETTLQSRNVAPLWVAIGVREWLDNAGGFDIAINSRPPPVTVTEGTLPFQNVCPYPINGMAPGAGLPVTWDGNDDDSSATDPVTLPFAFDLSGEAVTDAWMTTNGLIKFAEYPGINPFTNRSIPSTIQPNFFIAPLWDDLDFVSSCTMSEVDHAIFQWNGVKRSTELAVEMQLVLHADNSFDFIFGPNHRVRTDSATMGFENSAGDDGFNMVFNLASPLAMPGKSWTLAP